MVQVFSLQINLAAVLLRQAVGKVEWRRTSYVVTQSPGISLSEIFTLQDTEIVILQLLYSFVEYFGDICSTEFSVITFFVN